MPFINSPFAAQVHIIRSRNRVKTMSVQVTSEGIIVRVPERVPESMIWRWLEEKRSWLEKQLMDRGQPDANPTEAPWVVQPIYYQGNALRMRYTANNRSAWQFRTDGKTLCVSGPAANASDPAVRHAIIHWLREEAKATLIPRAAAWSRKLGYEYAGIRVKTQHSRWGSCSAKRNVNLNWRLVQTPSRVMDYVIVHELCHLKELNHSARFWRLVETAMPNYQEAIIWLKQHELLLQVP
ncbi:MAG: M48 family metallopeptidase [Alicyclobacillus sp.]|nr:M48 family metallopeptidase [Alicyclobacillus sp.]